jgi:hypothetical protein
MSSQLPVVWWYREVNCEVVGVYVEVGPVLGAESADNSLNQGPIIYFVIPATDVSVPE